MELGGAVNCELCALHAIGINIPSAPAAILYLIFMMPLSIRSPTREINRTKLFYRQRHTRNDMDMIFCALATADASDRIPSRSVVILIDRDIAICCHRMGYLDPNGACIKSA